MRYFFYVTVGDKIVCHWSIHFPIKVLLVLGVFLTTDLFFLHVYGHDYTYCHIVLIHKANGPLIVPVSQYESSVCYTFVETV